MPIPTIHTTRTEDTTKATLKKPIKTSTTTNIMTKVATLLVSNLRTHRMATGRHLFLHCVDQY